MSDLILIDEQPRFDDPFVGIDRANLGEKSKYRYRMALTRALEAEVDLTDRNAVYEFGQTLPASVRVHLRGALKATYTEMISQLKAVATPESVAAIQAIMFRQESLLDALPLPDSENEQSGYRLTAGQVENLLKFLPMEDGNLTVRGLQQFIILGLMLKGGLRRGEVVSLQWNQIEVREGAYWLMVKGKGNKKREVPIALKFGEALMRWGGVVGFNGCVARAMPGRGSAGALKSCISGKAVGDLVRSYGRKLAELEPNEAIKRSLSDLMPHDLRRTFGRLAYEGGVDIEEISKIYGHESAGTTRRYIGIDIISGSMASELIPFDL